MSSILSLKAADSIAKDYDRYVENRGWIGPDVIFELLKSEIRPNQRLLDIGIGTGLSSLQFHLAGLKVWGIDGSHEMLKECGRKNFTEALVQFDLSEKNFPFKGIKFDFIIAYGVFHIVGYIDHTCKEAAIRLSDKGIFLFSIVEYSPSLNEIYTAAEIEGIFVHDQNPAGILNFSHDDRYIRNLLNDSGLKLWMKKSFLAFKDLEEQREVYFSIYVCRKKAESLDGNG